MSKRTEEDKAQNVLSFWSKYSTWTQAQHVTGTSNGQSEKHYNYRKNWVLSWDKRNSPSVHEGLRKRVGREAMRPWSASRKGPSYRHWKMGWPIAMRWGKSCWVHRETTQEMMTRASVHTARMNAVRSPFTRALGKCSASLLKGCGRIAVTTKQCSCPQQASYSSRCRGREGSGERNNCEGTEGRVGAMRLTKKIKQHKGHRRWMCEQVEELLLLHPTEEHL